MSKMGLIRDEPTETKLHFTMVSFTSSKVQHELGKKPNRRGKICFFLSKQV